MLPTSIPAQTRGRARGQAKGQQKIWSKVMGPRVSQKTISLLPGLKIASLTDCVKSCAVADSWL